jgi:PIN domain nuclease of toxin-antitoxin system
LKLLLDTHIWLWSVLEPDRIGARTLWELESPANEKWFSPISAWELLMLVSKGRMHLDLAAPEWIAQSTVRLREAPLTTRIAVESRQIRIPHQDPADRFLVATAKVLGLTLVTADRTLLGISEISTLANL